MPKRRNPFGDPFATQFKTHVGQKEVDMGVNKDKNMKVVYEKTLSLLFDGQRNLARTNGHDVNGQGINGHHAGMNGHHAGMNGHHAGMNGHHTNGHTSNGHGMNGGHHITNGGSHQLQNGHNGVACNGITSQTNGHHELNALQQLNGYHHLSHNGHSASRHNGVSNGGGTDVEMDMDDGTCLVSGQSFLDSNCRLVHSQPNGAMTGDEDTTSCHNKVQSRPTCVMCRKNQQAKSRCHFCDKHLCGDCTRSCDNCQDGYCVLCTSVNYDERDERVFCVSCT